MNHQTRARLNPIRLGHGEHRHGFTQLLFGLGGAVRCEMAAAAFEVKTDQIGIVPFRAEHFFAGCSEESRLLVVDLFWDDDVVRQMQQLAPQPSFRDLFEAPRVFAMPGELHAMIGCAASQLAQTPGNNGLVAHQWASMLAVQVHRLLTGGRTDAADTRHERFQQLVDSRLANPPDNAELKRHMAMSGTTLNQWCRTRYGVTPQQAVLARRLHWARHQLLHSDRSITRIAHDTGFADAPGFTRAFVRVQGVTPGAMRQWCQTAEL